MEERQETQSRMKKHKEARLTEKGPCAVWPRMNIITVKSRYWTPKGKQEDSGKVLLVQWRPSGQRNAEYISFLWTRSAKVLPTVIFQVFRRLCCLAADMPFWISSLLFVLFTIHVHSISFKIVLSPSQH